MSAFIDSVVLARKEAADDAGVLSECVTQLQQHNRDLKQHIAQLDAEAVKEATAGWGTNDRKLIVSLCARARSPSYVGRRPSTASCTTRTFARRYRARRAATTASL